MILQNISIRYPKYHDIHFVINKYNIINSYEILQKNLYKGKLLACSSFIYYKILSTKFLIII